MNSRTGRQYALKIFRTGKHTAMSGKTIEFTENDLATTAATYNSAKHPAPIVLGHPQDDQPAYGWVKSLASNDGELFAEVERLSPDLLEAVRAGRYVNVSAAFHPPSAQANPVKGAWYLKHVGMLGSHPPAVKGLGKVSFADRNDGSSSLLIGLVEFAEGGLWDAPVEFTCAPGFTADPERLKIHQAALRYQHTHGVGYVEAVTAVSGSLLNSYRAG